MGGKLLAYTPQPGALTLMWYDVGSQAQEGQSRVLQFKGKYTTTVDQIALAFTSPSNLPDENVYEAAIAAELGRT